jgi:hypothetical protein
MSTKEKRRSRQRTIAGVMGEMFIARANELLAERDKAKREGVVVVEAKPLEDVTPIAAE